MTGSVSETLCQRDEATAEFILEIYYCIIQSLMESGLCKGMLLFFIFFIFWQMWHIKNIHTQPKDRQQFGFYTILNERDSVEVLLTGLEDLYIGMN